MVVKDFSDIEINRAIDEFNMKGRFDGRLPLVDAVRNRLVLNQIEEYGERYGKPIESLEHIGYRRVITHSNGRPEACFLGLNPLAGIPSYEDGDFYKRHGASGERIVVIGAPIPDIARWSAAGIGSLRGTTDKGVFIYTVVAESPIEG